MADRTEEAGFGSSPEDFDRLYDEYFPRVYRFLQKRLADQEAAERATREVFLELIGSLPEPTEAELPGRILQIMRGQLRRP